MASKRLDSYLAVFVGDDRRTEERAKVHLWDMLRYDQCFPLSVPDRFRGWIVFVRPFTTGRHIGFNLDRWESFGIRVLGVPYRGNVADRTNAVVGESHTGGSYAIPFEMEQEMRGVQTYIETQEKAAR